MLANLGTVITQSPWEMSNPFSLYIGNAVDFTAIITGVNINNIQVRQIYDYSYGQSAAGGWDVIHNAGELDGIFFSQGAFLPGGGVRIDSFGSVYEPEMRVTPNGAIVLRFSDGPGMTVSDPHDFGPTGTQNIQQFTTIVEDKSTGAILAQRTWSTAAKLNSDGSGPIRQGHVMNLDRPVLI